jgi:hypothetical protein
LAFADNSENEEADEGPPTFARPSNYFPPEYQLYAPGRMTDSSTFPLRTRTAGG